MDRLEEVNVWLARFESDCRSGDANPRLRIEYKTVGSRHLGRNLLPGRVWLDTPEQLFRLLGVTGDVAALDHVVALSAASAPDLIDWIARHPQLAIDHRTVWPELLAVVGWIRERPVSDLYLRQLDLPGVDTKFIETHHLILAALLEAVLPAERVDETFSRRAFAGRFGFRRRPEYTRLRLLGATTALPAAISEVTLRTEELARFDPPVSTVFIIENEISYLAFPDVDDAIVIFGSGFALETVKSLLWLAEKRIVYWGDVDTWGFAILNRLRLRFPAVDSILMDHETLLAHPRQWVTEPTPTNTALPHLTDTETALYRDLVEDRYGHHVRLEQERVRFSLLEAALRQLLA